jgi:hypothetical protein
MLELLCCQADVVDVYNNKLPAGFSAYLAYKKGQ